MQKNRRLVAELQKAHDLQMGLMPAQAPTRSGYDISGRFRPATHVGGDLFPYFESRQQISLALADVTGHGMEVAVPMLIFNGVLQSEVRHDPPLEEHFSVRKTPSTPAWTDAPASVLRWSHYIWRRGWCA